MAPIDALTETQREALARFLTAHERIAQANGEAEDAMRERARALVAARDAEVPVRLIVEASGLNRSRVFQIRKEGIALGG